MANAMHGRPAIITGGHVNLGLAIAHRFAEEGGDVLLVGRSQEVLQRAAAEVNEKNLGKAYVCAADVTAPEGPRSIVDIAKKTFGEVPKVLVNCAGFFVWRGMLEATDEDWQRTLDTQLTAPYRMMQALARALQAAGTSQGASFINVGSVHGPVGDGNVVHQCAAKAGVVGLTRGAAEALRSLGIRVNAILPGAIEPHSAATRSTSLDAKITQGDLAAMALYLASDAAAGITAACLEAYGESRPVIGRA